MTAYALLLSNSRQPVPGGPDGSSGPANIAGLGAAPPAPQHVQGDACRCPDCTRADRHAAALGELSDYLEEEGPSLSRLLRLIDQPGAAADLAALQSLHVAPGGEADALAEAAFHLERLVETLAETPTRAQTVGLVPTTDQALARDVDASVRWHGARATDILDVVRRGLS